MTRGPRTKMNDERRHHARYRVNLALGVQDGRRTERAGISQDASATGVLFNTRSRFEPGSSIDVTLHVSGAASSGGQGGAITVRGRVVRVEAVAPESNLLWRYLTAVEFDAPPPELEPTLRTRAEREGQSDG